MYVHMHVLPPIPSIAGSTASPSTDTTMKKSDISSSTQHLPSTEQAESDSKSEG